MINKQSFMKEIAYEINKQLTLFGKNNLKFKYTKMFNFFFNSVCKKCKSKKNFIISSLYLSIFSKEL